jgi:type II secretion system protein N
VVSNTGASFFSRPKGWLALASIGFVLFFFFLVIGFPYDRLAEFIAAEVKQSAGVQLTIGELGPSLHLQGLGLRAKNVGIEGSPGDPQAAEPYYLDRATVRAAWSTSWLRGRPAIHADLKGPLGRLSGTYTMGPEFGWDGVLEGVDLAAPPIREMLPNVYLTGRGDAEMNVKRGLLGPEGSVLFELTEGSVAFGDFPLAIPYENVAGSLVLGNETYLTIEELKVEGPLLSADVTGSIESSSLFLEAPMDLTIQMQVNEDLQIPLESAGVRFDKDGLARVRISGTPDEPIIN